MIINIAWFEDHNKGIVLLYETGNIPFNRFVLSRLKKKQYVIMNDSIYYKKKLIPVTEEHDIFRLIGYKYIPPQYRTSNSISHLWKLQQQPN